MDKQILLSHGSGGERTSQLIRSLFQKYLDDPLLVSADDAASLPSLRSPQLVYTTDSFVVSPIFFPGGDIGRLAVSGTVNDVSVMGARPLFLSIGFIIEEGFPLDQLEQILQSIKTAVLESGVRIVTADTKVVEKGKCDGIFINTSGIGQLEHLPAPSIQRIRPGDMLLINGAIGLHEMAVLSARKQFGLELEIRSDVAPLWSLVETLMGLDIRFMRDPTRGGLAQTLNEITEGQAFGIEVDENLLPVTEAVSGVCEILGFDPLHLANEGKVLIIAGEQDVEPLLSAMKGSPYGQGSAVIGRVTEDRAGLVVLKTSSFSQRVVMPPTGELVPRIC